MTGKKTNIFIGALNILSALCMVLYIFYFQNYSIDFTRYQKEVFEYIKIFVYGQYVVVLGLNVIYSLMSIRLDNRFIYYIISIIGGAILLNPLYVFALFPIISGILIIYVSVKNNIVEKENSFVQILNILLLIVMVGCFLSIGFSKKISGYIKSRESVSLVAYNKDFFKHIEPLKEGSLINVQINDPKDNKKKLYGFIDKNGTVKIDFIYDFVTPFYKIKVFDKEFEVASVSNKNISTVIMKNKRVVTSYNSEYDNQDYGLKIKEFEDVLKNTIKAQEISLSIQNDYLNLEPHGVAKWFVDLKNKYKDQNIVSENQGVERVGIDNTNKENQEQQEEDPNSEQSLKIAKEKLEKKIASYTYVFEFSQMYDVAVIKSQIDQSQKFKLINRENLEDQIDIDASTIIYNDTGNLADAKLYTYKEGYLPWLSLDKKEQGWYDPDGKRHKLSGPAIILDVQKARALIYNKAQNLSYFIDTKNEEGTPISPKYKQIIRSGDLYIVQNTESKWTILDENLNRKVKENFDVFKGNLLSQGLYIFANLSKDMEFNPYGYVKLNYVMINKNLQVIVNGSNYIYDIYSRYVEKVGDFLEGDKNYENFIEKVKNPNYTYQIQKYYDDHK